MSSDRFDDARSMTGSPGGTRSRRRPSRAASRIGDSSLAKRLSREIEGTVLFDAFSRGRYSTDASIYQIEPIGVVVPRSEEDVIRVIQIAAEEQIPVLPRGGGTSQCGQTVGEALVVDVSKHLNTIVDFSESERRVTVQPGLVLDHLNAFLRPRGLMFPVDPSTSSRATIGGMAGNNSCGSRSIRYGLMRDNVRAIDAILATGEKLHFGEIAAPGDAMEGGNHPLIERMIALGRREAGEVAARFPEVLRRVGGYNIDSLAPDGRPVNMAHLLVGSEGTLAFSTGIELDLHPIPAHKVLGVCHFPTFYEAMDLTRHIVKLDPCAVELVDRTMIELARDIPMFRSTVESFVRGEPEALLLVEFAGDHQAEQVRRLKDLVELMGDFGHPGAVVEAVDPAFQRAIWGVRMSGLNIMMSMKGEGKPISFIEDCAVPLDNLAEYTDRLTKIFHKHGTTGTWYAHASVACLHVRPILNLKLEADAKKMRAIAEEAFAMVREYKGSHSGEHGDGLVRSEFHESMFGGRLVRAFEEIKDAFDPRLMFNPGKIVRPSKMDDRQLFRYKPDYHAPPLDTALDWSAWGGFASAVEMCNNNGECRKFDAGVMCPSFRATGEEKDLTRGRANSLRLALSGQLGAGALTSEEMMETMKLCVGCKGCKRECPTGVDMARMKIEFLHHYTKRHGLTVRDRLMAYLPRYAPYASKLGALANSRDLIPGLAKLSEAILGLSARRELPRWRSDVFQLPAGAAGAEDAPEVVLLADTFNTYFEPENLHAAHAVLAAAGYRVHVPRALDQGRPLCCGRTFLAAGLVDEARSEARRMIETLAPFVARGIAVIGLEPACLLTLRDEFAVVLPGPETEALAGQAQLFEEFLAAELAAGRVKLDLNPIGAGRAVLHGHCHQKAFGVMGSVEAVLRAIPSLEVEVVQASCCGMAGAFGYQKETYDMSMRMGEASLFPAVRAAGEDAVIVADGTSCRAQIHGGTGRQAIHVARVLKDALGDGYEGTYP